MVLGKLTVIVEYAEGRKRWLFCRPIEGGKTPFYSKIGTTNVVYVEKNNFTKDLQKGDIFTFYAILDKIPKKEEWDNHYCYLKANPITKEIFESLLELYPQEHFLIK